MVTFAERLRNERINKNLNQTELADALFLGRTSISKYENGKQIPELSTLQKIASYFNVSIDYLLGKTYIRNYDEIKTKDKINKLVKENSINTIVSHFQGEEFTEDDLADIENFIKFILSKKKIKK